MREHLSNIPCDESQSGGKESCHRRGAGRKTGVTPRGDLRLSASSALASGGRWTPPCLPASSSRRRAGGDRESPESRASGCPGHPVRPAAESSAEPVPESALLQTP